jgi:hypothetical protein
MKIFKSSEPNGDQVKAAHAARVKAEEAATRIAQQAAAAEERARRLQVRLGEAALESVETQNPTIYQECNREYEAANAEAKRLADAARVAASKLAAAHAHETLTANADQIARIDKILKAGHDTAVEFQAAFGKAIKYWRKLCEQREAVILAYPGGRPPAGCLFDTDGLWTALQREIYRQSVIPNPQTGTPQKRGGIFPGARAGDLSLLAQPHKLQSLSDAIEKANGHVLDVLHGRKDLRTGQSIAPQPSGADEFIGTSGDAA